MVALELNPNFGYVIAVGLAAAFVHNGWMGAQVIKARAKYKVKYPAMYATAENCEDENARKTFNCVQRAHQNSLENYPSFLFLLTTAGVRHPLTAAGLGSIWLAGRLAYFMGYSTGSPNKRLNGSFGYIGLIGLLITAGKFSYELITNH